MVNWCFVDVIIEIEKSFWDDNEVWKPSNEEVNELNNYKTYKMNFKWLIKDKKLFEI